MQVSRNAPCPCGSGRKYKHCHGAEPARTAPEAARRSPAGARGTFERARDLHRKGYLDEAETLYREGLQRSPRDAGAMSGLGILAAQRGDPASALEWIGKAAAIEPQSAAYRFNYGKALLQLGRAAEAREALERAIALDPGYAEAYHELGLACEQAGRPDAAEAAFRRALALAPRSWEVHNNLGLLLHRRGRYEDAALSLRRAVEIEPRSISALRNLGMALRAQNRAEEAVDSYRAALALHPRDPATLSNLGNALVDLGRREEAIACFRDAAALAPRYADAYHNWGLLHLRAAEFHAASEKFRAALALDPQSGETASGLASALHDLGNVEESIEIGRRTLLLRPEDSEAHSQLLFSLLHSPSVGPEEAFNEHRDWARRHASGLASGSAAHRNTREPERRLRVGYVSGDFRHHSVAQFFEPVLARHDHSGFEIFCYYNFSSVDATTERLRAQADHWRDIPGLGDEEVADRVRADGIDILVDLSGHTKYNRLLVFARKPAPVQVSWLGYPETTGLESIDYRISDAIADPPGAANFGSETVLRLTQGFLCYQAPPEAPMVGALPATSAGCVTFGSFNSLAKVNDRVVGLWQRILDEVPGSRLLLKAHSTADPGTRAASIERLVAQGIAPDRLDCAPGTPTRAEHLAAYSKVDIALDPFPYNGTTTTCEALWMGVPVVTLSGERHAGRVGASLLTGIGMDNLVARTPDAYVAAAVDLAREPARLAALRAGMRERMTASPLMDATRLARSVEQAYRSVWRRWCENPGEGGGR